MARTCPRCKRYLGAQDHCTRCDGPSSPNRSPHGSRRVVLPPTSSTSPPPPWERQPEQPTPASPRRTSGRSGFLSVRGEVVSVSPTGRAWVWGVFPIRTVLLLGTPILFLIKARDLIVGATLGLFMMLWPLLLILAIASWLLSKVHLDGCMSALLRMVGSIFGTGLRLGANLTSGAAPSRHGWQVIVEHSGGREHVNIAADIPIDEGQVLLVHGPRLGTTREAWLVQGVTPMTFTRLGRGLVSTTVLVLLLTPVIVWLLSL